MFTFYIENHEPFGSPTKNCPKLDKNESIVDKNESIVDKNESIVSRNRQLVPFKKVTM